MHVARNGILNLFPSAVLLPAPAGSSSCTSLLSFILWAVFGRVGRQLEQVEV
ncbi:hypothetical protein JMJ77_0005160, partial [Colletotrichum scovillei]